MTHNRNVQTAKTLRAWLQQLSRTVQTEPESTEECARSVMVLDSKRLHCQHGSGCIAHQGFSGPGRLDQGRLVLRTLLPCCSRRLRSILVHLHLRDTPMNCHNARSRSASLSCMQRQSRNEMTSAWQVEHRAYPQRHVAQISLVAAIRW